MNPIIIIIVLVATIVCAKRPHIVRLKLRVVPHVITSETGRVILGQYPNAVDEFDSPMAHLRFLF